MLRNVASQKIALFAFDYSTGAPKTGDAANLTFYVNKDWAGINALGDTSASELSSTNAPGWYVCDLTQSETDAETLHFTGKSSTANVAVVGQEIATHPANFTSLSIDSNGRTDIIKVAGTTQTAGDIIGDTNDIQSRLPAALISGRIDATVGAMQNNVITALAIATDAIDNDALAASAVTEIQAGLSSLDAAGIRAAVGLASANLDTQLSGIDTKTTNLPSDPADQSLVIAASTAIFDRIGAPAGASIAADIATKATPAQVNAEVLDVLDVDTYPEIGQETPPATTTPLTMIRYVFKATRNEWRMSATQRSLMNDAGTVVDQKSTVSQSSGQVILGKLSSGP